MIKEQSLSVLIKQADEVFSEFIRARDSVWGKIHCFICDKSLFWRDSDCMHFIDRDQMMTRYDEMNCHAGCVECNRMDDSHKLKYLRVMKAKYGDGAVLAMNRKAQGLAKFTRPELQELIVTYKEKVKELRKQKHL